MDANPRRLVTGVENQGWVGYSFGTVLAFRDCCVEGETMG